MCFLIFTAIGVHSSPGGTEINQTWGCFVAPWWFGNGKHDNQGESHMICPKSIDSSWLTKSLSISREMVLFGGHLGIPQAAWQNLQLAREDSSNPSSIHCCVKVCQIHRIPKMFLGRQIFLGATDHSPNSHVAQHVVTGRHRRWRVAFWPAAFLCWSSRAVRLYNVVGELAAAGCPLRVL